MGRRRERTLTVGWCGSGRPSLRVPSLGGGRRRPLAAATRTSIAAVSRFARSGRADTPASRVELLEGQASVSESGDRLVQRRRTSVQRTAVSCLAPVTVATGRILVEGRPAL